MQVLEMETFKYMNFNTMSSTKSVFIVLIPTGTYTDISRGKRDAKNIGHFLISIKTLLKFISFCFHCPSALVKTAFNA